MNEIEEKVFIPFSLNFVVFSIWLIKTINLEECIPTLPKLNKLEINLHFCSKEEYFENLENLMIENDLLEDYVPYNDLIQNLSNE